MLIKHWPNGIDMPFSSEITPRAVFESRRSFIKQIAAGSIAGGALFEMANREAFAQGVGLPKLAAARNRAFSVLDKQSAYKDATTYNNFYEFGTGKGDPAQYAGSLKTQPWSIEIEGEVKKPMRLDLDALMKLAPLEERVYRLRCVEGWSMVIPWIGYSLSNLIKKVEPTANAKYIEFITLADKSQMPGLSSNVLTWPYVEGLRMDEANHPLAMLTLGMYGQTLPNQNGAPVRTAWNSVAPDEYGFYSNVNPNVDHPRWSQATERRIGEDGFFTPKRKTLMFNGYSDVASLYTGMDLKKFF
jgi:sulfoxide reductase catalytic subunit YedY